MTFSEFTRGANAVFKFSIMLFGAIYIFVTASENLFEDPIYTILVVIFYYLVFADYTWRRNVR